MQATVKAAIFPDVRAAGCGAGYSCGGSIPLMFGQQAEVQVTVVAAGFP